MIKHTPGPWVVDGNDISPADNDRLGICSVQPVDDVRGGWRYGEQTFANGHLIAAAPDLLEALELILEARTQEKHMWNAKPGESPLHDRCRAAIAKARGEQS